MMNELGKNLECKLLSSLWDSVMTRLRNSIRFRNSLWVNLRSSLWDRLWGSLVIPEDDSWNDEDE